MALCRELGPENVGLSTGDATVNRDAAVLCCTAEVLANIALREGADAPVDDVVMDEFHWYADRDRGVAWQVPLLTLPHTRFLLMSATLGDVTFFEEALTRLNGRTTVTVKSRGAAGAPRVRLLGDPARPDAREARLGGARRPSTSSTSRRQDAADSAQDFTSLNLCTREEKNAVADAIAGFRFTSPYGPDIRKWLKQGIGAAPRGPAAEVPRARGAARPAGPAQGHLRHGHPRGRHQRPHPHRALHAALQVRRAEDGRPLRPRLPPDRGPRRAQGVRRPRLRGGAGAGARDREPAARRRRRRTARRS